MKDSRLKWSISKRATIDLNPSLSRYKRFLKDRGYRDSTIFGYYSFVRVYLKFAKTTQPTVKQAFEFRETLIESFRKPSTINNYSLAIRLFHKMQNAEEDIKFPLLKVNNKLNFYFSEEEILRLLSEIKNLKHLAMVSLLFYCMLRASDLCALNDDDIDLKSLNLRILDGKFQKAAILPIPPNCGEILKQYLQIRPPLEIDGKNPLFYTDFSHRWDRRDLYRMIISYKNKAGIKKSGGCHLLRYSAASIFIKNGGDVATLKELMRHENIETTSRYISVLDSTKRQKLEQYLVL